MPSKNYGHFNGKIRIQLNNIDPLRQTCSLLFLRRVVQQKLALDYHNPFDLFDLFLVHRRRFDFRSFRALLHKIRLQLLIRIQNQNLQNQNHIVWFWVSWA